MGSNSTLEVRPSDLDQAFVRVAFVSAVVLWSYANAPASTPLEALNYKYFTLAFSYWTFSLLAYGWTYFFIQRVDANSPILIATRIVSIFADIGAISGYTAISGSFGVILFPVYLNSIIGYGYRFGVKYLYFTLAVAAMFFSIAVLYNQNLRESRELVFAYYLGIVLVPLYSASLLKRHREVLERIRDLNDARSRFIANMSHELRTPLHAIISVSDVLKETIDDARSYKESRHQKMQMISDSAQHLLGLVNKILDVASAGAGKVPTRQLEWINVVSVVQTALRICQPNAQQQGLGFFWFFDAQIPTWIKSSGEYLQEILINTVGNAVKYTQNGHVTVRFLHQRIDGRAMLSVSIVDTGIGISSKLLPNIFEPFTLGDDSAARKYSGTGLGLTLTKQYVELLGGQISFQSVENFGTHCKILLPIEEGRDDETSQLPDISRRCIYLASTPPTAREMTTFRESGWVCTPVGTAALAGLASNLARVVFIDSNLISFQEIIFDKVKADQRRRLYVCYGELEPSQVQHPMFNSAVSRSSMHEMKRIHFLERASLPYLDDEPVSRLRAEIPVHVLLADDNPTNLATARMALESVGHSVVCVSSGEEALSALDQTTFGLAFVDMHMPGMSGIEVVQIYQFVSNGAGTPVIILTADATTEAREAAEACGAVAFMTKPLRAREFRDAVTSFALGATNLPIQQRAIDAPDAGRVSVIDRTELEELMQIGVSPEELSEMILEFESDSSRLIEQSVVHQARGDFIAFKETMHALKGAAATLGASRLSAYAHSLERMSGYDPDDGGLSARRLQDTLSESLRLFQVCISEGVLERAQRH